MKRFLEAGSWRSVLLLSIILAFALSASSCGRRGGLEPPPYSQVEATDENGNRVKAPKTPDRPFVLDPLLY